MSRPWLISRRVDLALLSGPALLCAAVAVLLPPGLDVGPLGFVLLVVGLDVAHVWASLWRTYLDPVERARRPLLYALTPLGCAAVAVALHGVWPAGFWTAMAYLAVFHFVRQQVGFTALYRAVQGLPPRSLDARVERALVYALTLWPLVWWHAHLPQSFAWFLPGDFVVGLPQAAVAPAGALTLGLLGLHLALRWRSRLWSPGRDLWVLATGATWTGGIVLGGGDLAFTLSNVVAHGLPYLALVAWAVGRRWALTGQGPGRPGWFRGGGLVLFAAPLLALAWLEEGLWDALVWQEHPWLGLGLDWSAWAGWWAVPLLSVPQLTHYVLDGLIWRLGEANPGLREVVLGEAALGEAQGPAPRHSQTSATGSP